MDIEEKKKIARKCSKNLMDVAKVVLANGNTHAAEQFVLIAKSLECYDENDAMLAEIEAEELKSINLEGTQGKTNQSESKGGPENLKFEDTSQNKDPVRKYSLADTHSFSMRRNVLWMTILESDVLETDTDNELKNEMSKYSNMAYDEFQNNNFDTAHQHLLHAESIHNYLLKQRKDTTKFETVNNNNETKVVVKPKSAPLSVIFKGNEGDEVRCIRVAQEAITVGDFKKAEKFLLKAERICPSDIAKNLLQEIRDSVSNNHYEDTNHKKINSDNEDSRMKAKYSRGVNEAAQAVEAQYSDIVAGSASAGNNETPTPIQDRKVEPAKSDKNLKVSSATLDASVKTIKNSDNDCSTNKIPLSTKSDNDKLLTALSVTAKVNKNYEDNAQFKQSNDKHKHYLKLRERARLHFKRGNLIEAEQCLFEAQKLNPCVSVELLLKQTQELMSLDLKATSKSVLALKSESFQGKTVRNQSAYSEAENWFKEAQFAFTTKNLEKAEELLLKAENLRSSVRQKALLSDVREAKVAAEKSTNRPRSNHSKVDKLSNNYDPKTPTVSETLQKKEVVHTRGNNLNDVKNCNDSAAAVTKVTGYEETERSNVYQNVNEEVAGNSLNREQDAFIVKNYTTKRPVLEVQNLHPSSDAVFKGKSQDVKKDNDVIAETEINITAVKVNDLETLDDTKKSNVEKCINNAWKALSNGDFEKAERLLLKAERFHPTNRARELLNQVHEAATKGKN